VPLKAICPRALRWHRARRTAVAGRIAVQRFSGPGDRLHPETLPMAASWPDHIACRRGPECAIEIPVEVEWTLCVAFHPSTTEDLLIVAARRREDRVGDVLPSGEGDWKRANFVCVVMASDFAVRGQNLRRE